MQGREKVTGKDPILLQGGPTARKKLASRHCLNQLRAVRQKGGFSLEEIKRCWQGRGETSRARDRVRIRKKRGNRPRLGRAIMTNKNGRGEEMIASSTEKKRKDNMGGGKEKGKNPYLRKEKAEKGPPTTTTPKRRGRLSSYASRGVYRQT